MNPYFKLFKSLLSALLPVVSFLFVVIFLIFHFNSIKLSKVIHQHPNSIILFVSICAVITGILMQRQTAIEKNTLDFEEKYKHDEDIVENVKLTIKACQKKPEEIELIARHKGKVKGQVGENNDAENIKFYQAINSILNEWERAANAIEYNLYDDKKRLYVLALIF